MNPSGSSQADKEEEEVIEDEASSSGADRLPSNRETPS
jgi:hypothetical protein